MEIVSGSQEMLLLLFHGELLLYSFFEWACLRSTGSYIHTCVGGWPSCCMWGTGGPNRKRSHAQRLLAHSRRPSTALEGGRKFLHIDPVPFNEMKTNLPVRPVLASTVAIRHI